MMKKKRKFEKGDVYAIPLKSGEFAFGLCCGNDFAFFGCKTDHVAIPEELQSKPLAFRVPVAKDATWSGGWGYLGNVELIGEFNLPGRYLHKAIGSDLFFIYSGGSEVQVSKDACFDLEVLATWFGFHINERLEDFFAGRSNQYVKAIRDQLGV